MKRFYKLVSTQKTQGGHEILLDGRAVKTPARRMLLAPTEKLANLIMREWMAQEDEIRPAAMPLTQILSTKIDRVATERPAMSAALLKYLNTDMTCYHTDEPPELAIRQKEAWQPWLIWFADKFGASLQTTNGLAALTQPPQAHSAAAAHVEKLDNGRFTALAVAVPLSGSLVLGLAFVDGALSADALFAAARVEENFKAELYNEAKYGPDPAQEEKDRAALADLKAAEIFLQSL